MKIKSLVWIILPLLVIFNACSTPTSLAATPTLNLTRQPKGTATPARLPTITIQPATRTAITTQSPSPQPTNTPAPSIQVRQSDVEVVTDRTSTGDGGNAWGGHQTRIVHTQEGIFTAYTINSGDDFHREWHLVKRQAAGDWVVIAKGDAGKDPVNLLAAPDGTLYVVGWPNGIATLWSGKPKNGTIDMTTKTIPNEAHGNWPYSSAGIDEQGDLCILSSSGGENPVGWFNWACYYPSTGRWIIQTNQLDYRYCYTYLFPRPNGELFVVSTRDVRWSAFGYNQPWGTFDYVFNAFGLWRTSDTSKITLKRVYNLEERQTVIFPNVILDAQQDAYLDTMGNMHVIYRVQGQSTNGGSIARQAVLAPDGSLIADVRVPAEAGDYSRIFQDKEGHFYLLGSGGWLYPMDQDGIQFGDPVQLDFGRYNVEYSGFGLSVPRTGTPLSDVIDVVFPSRSGSEWIYFQLDFSSPTNQPPVSATPTGPIATLSVSSLQRMMDTAKVLFDANLVDPTLPGMDWWGGDRSWLLNQNGEWIFKGNESNGPQLHSQYGLKENEAAVALMRFSGTPSFQFKAMAGNWDDPDGASWGIVDGPQTFYQVAQNDFISTPLDFQIEENHWYYLILWMNGPEQFMAGIWDKDNQAIFAERLFQMDNTKTWLNRRWNWDLLVNSGTVEISRYRELQFSKTP